jgi:hypothetical protein
MSQPAGFIATGDIAAAELRMPLISAAAASLDTGIRE